MSKLISHRPASICNTFSNFIISAIAQYPYISGYLSEPEPGAYDSDHMEYKYATLDRRRIPTNDKENFTTSTMPRNNHWK